MLRTLVSQPTFSADWSSDYEEKSAEWFELFLDLLMVCACSNVAEKLKDDYSVAGVVYFALMLSIYSCSWSLYISFHARFNERSLLHYVLLYPFLSGLGGMLLASDPGADFTTGLVWMRTAAFFMYTWIYAMLPKARPSIWIDLVFLLVSLVLLFASLAFGRDDSSVVVVYAAVWVWEVPVHLFVGWKGYGIPTGCRIPFHIDHMTERLGCLVMVVLGESVVSLVINVHDKSRVTPRFFSMMQWAIVVIFSMAIFYFSVQPPRDLHAMRRSIFAGVAFNFLHWALYPPLLALGVGTKFVSEAIVNDTTLESPHVWLLFGSTALSMAIMFSLRLTHFIGRHPAPTDPHHVKMIKYGWWAIVGASPLLPLACAVFLEWSSDYQVDPIMALQVLGIFNVIWIVIESIVIHYLNAHGQTGFRNSADETAPLAAKAHHIRD
ncbi:Aste57867_14813 [Aphanomyces stellatus]|uniref:Aste57867_14813 protein n=1 Tax=Aphanomyces stellatus TaxID=120398 RepID=A0A485L1Y2_9STRA|nr:hypothetical protein As57867_014757 [Aphanomyces stellatus]VFT91631.1 Aste57867_14813 [Aphanomyces stellatus]